MSQNTLLPTLCDTGVTGREFSQSSHLQHVHPTSSLDLNPLGSYVYSVNNKETNQWPHNVKDSFSMAKGCLCEYDVHQEPLFSGMQSFLRPHECHPFIQ